MNRFLHCLSVLVSFVALTGSANASSTIVRLALPELVEAKHDLQLILYHRDGKLHQLFAT